MNKPFFDSNWHFGDLPGSDCFSLSKNCKQLIDAICRQKAVVYLGAGVSKAAGLPDWKEFLRRLAEEATGYCSVTARSAASRIESGELLVAAEMLQNALGTNLQEMTQAIFGKCIRPTAIHNAVASVPFSLSITTNYDSLAESAYGVPVPKLTWQNPYDLLQNLRSGEFCVLKLHGDYAVRKSIVLTRTNYRDLMQVNEMLQNCIRMLLATRCFLFIGVSFSDPDLLALMDEARALYGDAFGPHFAIFPQAFHDAAYSDVLLKSYNIFTIVAPDFKDSSGAVDPVTNGVAAVVSHIGGHVSATHQLSYNPLPQVNRSGNVLADFGERMMAGAILKDLVSNLGQVYGEVSMLNPRRAEQRVIFQTLRYSMQEQALNYDDSYQMQNPTNSLQNRVYLQRKIEDDFCVVGGGVTAEDQGFRGAIYTFRDRNSSSALVVPIYVDGRREGVVAIEAKAGFHFSKFHYQVVRSDAQRLGAVRNEANRSYKLASSLRHYGDMYKNFLDFLRRSRDLDNINLNCLVYQIDPYRGSLSAPLPTDDDRQRMQAERWSYNLEENSLACKAFRERRTVREPRSEKIGSTQLDTPLALEGKEFFDISGPVVGFPINVDGNTAGVFVGWSKDAKRRTRPSLRENKDRPKWRVLFWRAMERAKRMVHLLANEPAPLDLDNSQRAVDFLEYVSNKLAPIDERKDWGTRVSDADFRAAIIDRLLAALVDSSCGLSRARLFAFNKASDGTTRATCVGSCSNSKSIMPGQRTINQYLGASVPPAEYVGQDPFLQFTMGRSEFDPYARVQDSMTVGGPLDPTMEQLDKVPGGDWLVAPVGPQVFDIESGERIRMDTVGYMAADNYLYDEQLKIMVQPNKFACQSGEVIFQRYCMDFVSDLFSVFIGKEAASPTVSRPKQASATKRTRRKPSQ